MEGSAFPVSILLIYPAFCPIERLISRAETPFFVLNIASLVEKSSSCILSRTPLLYYGAIYFPTDPFLEVVIAYDVRARRIVIGNSSGMDRIIGYKYLDP